MEVSFANVVLLHVLVKNIFPWPYNGRNQALFSPGCYDDGIKLHFPVFPWQGHLFCGKKLRLGSTLQNEMVLFSFFLSWWCDYTPYCANWSMIIFIWFPTTTLCWKMTKNGHNREESYEGHLGFKSTVSPLIFPFGEEERKKKTSIMLCGTQSYRKAKRRKN